MNQLSTQDRGAVIRALCEGNSIRSTCRMTGAAKDTVTRLLVATGRAASDYQDAVLRDLPCKRIQADEVWGFVYAKARNVEHAKKPVEGAGDVWTWTALCQDTKLVPSWLLGKRDAPWAAAFIDDLASRLANRVQLTTDGHRAYLEAVDYSFGENIDYAMLVKLYGQERPGEARYSPAKYTGCKKERIKGNPDMASVSTSHVERQNLTMRMGMRRLTRLTNGFSKKIENMDAALALHFMYRNFAAPHGALKGATPAQAAGVSRYRWTAEDIASLLDDPQYADALKVQMHRKASAS